MNQKDILTNLEKEYEVSKIEYNGIKIWPIFRLYIADKINEKIDEDYNSKSESIGVFSFIKPIFFMSINILKIPFIKFDILSFSKVSSITKIGNRYYDRILGKVHQENKCLNVFNLKGLYKDANNLINFPESILYLFQVILFPFTKVDFKGRDILEDIITENQLEINYTFIFKRFKTQILIGKFLIKSVDFEKVLVINHPSYFGFLYAFNRAGIPTYEYQHGIFNSNHPSYYYEDNSCLSLEEDKKIFPQKLVVFSDYFKDIAKKFKWIKNEENILVEGYFLPREFRRQNDNKEEVTLDLISFAGQDAYDKRILPFFYHTVERLGENLKFQYVFRNKIPSSVSPKFNVSYSSGNLYQVLRRSEVHVVYTSTTFFEALFLGCPVIVIAIDDLAEDYFNEFKNYYGVEIVSSVEEFIHAYHKLLNIDREKVKNIGESLI